MRSAVEMRWGLSASTSSPSTIIELSGARWRRRRPHWHRCARTRRPGHLRAGGRLSGRSVQPGVSLGSWTRPLRPEPGDPTVVCGPRCDMIDAGRFGGASVVCLPGRADNERVANGEDAKSLPASLDSSPRSRVSTRARCPSSALTEEQRLRQWHLRVAGTRVSSQLKVGDH